MLVAQYQRLHGSSDIPRVPIITSSDTEQLSHLVLALALCGDHAQWGAALPVHAALDEFLTVLGLTSVAQLLQPDEHALEAAVTLCLRAAPEQRVSECIRICREIACQMAQCGGDLGCLAVTNPDEARLIIHVIADDPVAELAIMVALGLELRPMPSGGAAQCLVNIGCLERWEPDYFRVGHQAVRETAMKFLEQQPPIVMFAVEHWAGAHSLLGCPSCTDCAAFLACDALVSGLV